MSINFSKECLKDGILIPRTFLGRKVASGTEISLYVLEYSTLKKNVIYYITLSIGDLKWTCNLMIAKGTLFAFLSTNAEFKNPAAALLKVSGKRVENDIEQYKGLLVSVFCHKSIMEPKNMYLENHCLIIQFKYDDIYYFANCDSLNHVEDGIELCRNFKYLYLTACCADLKIQVRDVIFWVHKAILSVRSKMFEKFFQGNQPSPNKLTFISIDEEPFYFHKVLIYIYSGEFDHTGLDEIGCFAICKIANRLNMNILERKCVDIFRNIFTPSNIASIMISANESKLNALIGASTCYMIEKDMSSILADILAGSFETERLERDKLRNV